MLGMKLWDTIGSLPLAGGEMVGRGLVSPPVPPCLGAGVEEAKGEPAQLSQPEGCLQPSPPSRPPSLVVLLSLQAASRPMSQPIWQQ